MPADAAWHCSRLVKLQLVICPVTSVRQNSAALAGVVIAPTASAANNAAAAAVDAFKNVFLMLSCSFWFRLLAPSDGGLSGLPRRRDQSGINQY
jgi:hypothetical protein